MKIFMVTWVICDSVIFPKKFCKLNQPTRNLWFATVKKKVRRNFFTPLTRSRLSFFVRANFIRREKLLFLTAEKKICNMWKQNNFQKKKIVTRKAHNRLSEWVERAGRTMSVGKKNIETNFLYSMPSGALWHIPPFIRQIFTFNSLHWPVLYESELIFTKNH